MSMWSNFCVSSAYEPGSTYKPFTVAAALDEGVVKDSDYFNCDGGLTVSGVRIRCSNPDSGHGSIFPLKKGLMESCNSALMVIGQKLGATNFSKYNKIFGFGQKTGIDLPGETAGLIHSEEELNPVELATSSFGQTQTVTMVQMAAGFSSLVNGGDYYEPHIVKEIQNENGAIVKKNEPIVVKKTVSDKTKQSDPSVYEGNGRRRNCCTGGCKRIFYRWKDRNGAEAPGDRTQIPCILPGMCAGQKIRKPLFMLSLMNRMWKIRHTVRMLLNLLPRL